MTTAEMRHLRPGPWMASHQNFRRTGAEADAEPHTTSFGESTGTVSTDLLVRWLATELCMRSHSVLEKWLCGKGGLCVISWQCHRRIGVRSHHSV
jgi:hypothetical protein